MTLNMLLPAVIVGLTGTFIFDLWGKLLQRLFKVRAPDWGRLGQWLFVAARWQRAVGLLAHYLTGIVFALVFMLVVGPAWIARPTPLPAILAGIGTVPLAWFIIMPALGHGVAASRLPHPNRIRALTLLAHAVLGFGFYAGGCLVRMIP